MILRSELFRLPLLLACCAMLAACAAPKTIITQPVSSRPQPQATAETSNGAIFQAANAKLLFEEPNARMVGDTLLVQIEENLTAANSANSKTSRAGTIDVAGNASAPYFPGVLEKLFNATITGSSTNTFEGDGETNASNRFRGSIMVTVVNVLPNGNLVVGGEKQVAINGELNTVRLTGVVSSRDIKAGNTVSSTRVADARLEQVGEGAINDSNTMGWLQRFFLSVWPL
ncbi:flagellar basal body L-ring protein FlgH [Chitinilyticum litopenaei]|uniref:flagellar basal body L-ring protein FlgH n=1 Tax=Chitinilyticum litopenaei TaxID=1121276 RepID=UPI0004099A96|nr:flagellar basal body L-ring protein FlgH [Chitinilyticum litopenaei]